MLRAIRLRRKSPLNNTSTKTDTVKRRLSSRLKYSIDVAIVAVAVLSLIYVAALAVNVVSGYSVTAATPERMVRLQVVDGIGDKELVRDVVALLRERADLELSVEVVERVRFDLREVPRTFIIARTEDQSTARLLAQRLGLDPDEVTRKPLDQNSRFVTATLVLGQDARDLLFVKRTAEER